jgi:Mn2+/Fe2+ NRAMP family transporter
MLLFGSSLTFLLPFVSFIFLSLENYGVRKLEAVFAFLIATMAISFAWMFTDTKPNGKDLLIGKE